MTSIKIPEKIGKKKGKVHVSKYNGITFSSNAKNTK